MRCVLALDQGTTSSRAIVFDRRGRAVFTIEARMVFGLLTDARAGDAPGERLVLPRAKAASLRRYCWATSSAIIWRCS